jgi:hypothetical protein
LHHHGLCVHALSFLIVIMRAIHRELHLTHRAMSCHTSTMAIQVFVWFQLADALV